MHVINRRKFKVSKKKKKGPATLVALMAHHKLTLLSRNGIAKIHMRFSAHHYFVFREFTYTLRWNQASSLTKWVWGGYRELQSACYISQLCAINQPTGTGHDLSQICDRPGIYNSAWETWGNHTDVAGMLREQMCTVLVWQAESLNDPHKKFPCSNPPNGRGIERRVSVRRCCSAIRTCAGELLDIVHLVDPLRQFRERRPR